MRKARERPSYAEGDVVVVPLGEAGFALGVVARRPRLGHIAIGYFFGPRLGQPPKSIPPLAAESAVMLHRFGDGEILSGGWPNLGQLAGWKREEWPNPVFGRPATASLGARVSYPDDDPGGKAREEYVPLEEIQDLPTAGLANSLWIEEVLALRLQGKPSAPIWVREERPTKPPPAGDLTITPQNSFALGGLGEAGSDLTKPHPFHFYSYFPERSQADQASERMYELGYSVEVTPGAKGGWLALATALFLPDEEELERREAELGKLASKMGGNYDGWEAEVVRS